MSSLNDLMKSFGDTNTKHISRGRIDIRNNRKQSQMYLDKNLIAMVDSDGELFIDNHKQFTKPILTCLNSLPGVNIETRGIDWVLNGMVWDGSLKRVREYKETVANNGVNEHE